MCGDCAIEKHENHIKSCLTLEEFDHHISKLSQEIIKTHLLDINRQQKTVTMIANYIEYLETSLKILKSSIYQVGLSLADFYKFATAKNH